MYKKIFLPFFLVILLTLSGCSLTETNNNRNEISFVKSVWFAYYELSELTKNNNENDFIEKVNEIFKELSKKGFNRITVQVRPFADSFYNSAYFPVSSYCFGEQGSELIYDPLTIMVDLAHKNNLQLEAWVNPYRVSNSVDFSALSNKNIAVSWQNTENLIVCDEGIYFNPASSEAQNLIINGVKEIIENYQVDSVCFDDYFYPTTNKKIDSSSYKNYCKNGGKLSLDDWRRDNVNKLIKAVYKTVKSSDKNISFGISPASNVENDYSSLYADVELWSTEKGYVDYICPQIYFGFQNENQPFMNTTKAWSQMAVCDLYVSLPLYKQGEYDEFAGESGKREFIENNNIISRQYTYLTKVDKVSGFYVFSYSSLGNNDESENLYSAMQKSSQ